MKKTKDNLILSNEEEEKLVNDVKEEIKHININDLRVSSPDGTDKPLTKVLKEKKVGRPKENKVQVYASFKKVTYDKIIQLSQEQDRSISNTINHIVEKYFEEVSK